MTTMKTMIIPIDTDAATVTQPCLAAHHATTGSVADLTRGAGGITRPAVPSVMVEVDAFATAIRHGCRTGGSA